MTLVQIRKTNKTNKKTNPLKSPLRTSLFIKKEFKTPVITQITKLLVISIKLLQFFTEYEKSKQ